MDITFGPIPSRRLGRSLGINNIPPKRCSYSCIYCQVGPTAEREIRPRGFYAPEEVCRQVTQRAGAVRARGETIDYLTFVPDGEPTLDVNLAAMIEGLKPLGLPIAVISNASLIWRTEVRDALARADWVSLKLDSVDEALWRRINQPHPALLIGDILEGIRTFAGTFTGTLASETMLVAGINDGDAAINAVGGFLESAGIRRSYLAIPHRPPAEAGVRGPDEAAVTRAFQRLSAWVPEVELLTGYEGDAFSYSGDLRADLLATTAVHPMRESAVRALVKQAGQDWAVVEAMIEAGDLRRVEFQGGTFYIRRLHGN